MLGQPSPVTEIIRWIQLVLSIFYPIGVLAVLFLAWRDFRRMVDNQVELGKVSKRLDQELEAEVREFSE